ncbi:hypothetical protein WH47_10876 [Habropoda laboriosa]|uniref:Uncharacterized protein n=1 Tax=Habropoda laboriosa TaxID=597456 RepID=A0A0L7RDG3_9HYME|nr:hypothetical protein WH47_10876 [Habropoda laboriosa]
MTKQKEPYTYDTQTQWGFVQFYGGRTYVNLDDMWVDMRKRTAFATRFIVEKNDSSLRRGENFHDFASKLKSQLLK